MPLCARAAGARLERSCARGGADWLHEQALDGGVSRLRAGLKRHAFTTHRHDTYTVALTDSGVQEFAYRGRVHRSRPGQLVVLHPDELHDGRPGSADGFTYRGLHLDPARIGDAVRACSGHASALPFIADPVLDDPALAAAVTLAFELPPEPLGVAELIDTVGAALMRAARRLPDASKPRSLGPAVLARAREFLDANCTRVVRSGELEDACGETRFTLSAPFKRRYGTSPYRYLLMRRLEHVRSCLAGPFSLADLALEAGFADQAHLTRVFRAGFGMTPAAYARLRAAALTPPRWPDGAAQSVHASGARTTAPCHRHR